MNPLHNTSKVDFEISLKETCFGIIVRFLASKISLATGVISGLDTIVLIFELPNKYPLFLLSHSASKKLLSVQPVPEKMRLEMLVETQIEILDGQSSGLF